MSILICNVTWLENYTGPEEVVFGGGSHVEKHKRGNEELNFADLNGKYYGYVATQGHEIKIERLGASSNDDYIDNILVVWVARHPDRTGVKIIGWYKNARLYRSFQYNIAGEVYNIVANPSESVLLPVTERVFDVPRANIEGAGKGMGRSNYWYADNYPESKAYIEKVEDYIDNYKGEQLNYEKSSMKILNEHGFNLGDSVKLMSGVRFDDLKDISLGGWEAKIEGTVIDQNGDALVFLKYTPDTIKNMPSEFIEYKKKVKVDHTVEFVYVNDIKKVG